MLFELEGEPPRAIAAKAGEAFWEPGGDVIHYSDANNRSDIQLRFLVTMVCAPGQPMMVVVDDDELEETPRQAGISTKLNPQEALGAGVKNPQSLAFGHSLNRISGTLNNGDRTDFWLRWTTWFPEDRRQRLTAELGGGPVCLWSHNVPDDPSADVWIEASDRIIGGGVG